MHWTLVLGLFLILLILVQAFGAEPIRNFFFPKVYWKRDLADYYGVDPKTLSKMVKNHAPELFDRYNSIRRLSSIMVKRLFVKLGRGIAFSKTEIQEFAGARDLKDMKSWLFSDDTDLVVTESVYENSDKFPPRIANQMIRQLSLNY